jgi:tRNA-Thr(GGU) m(6)t(6)A37 methyltransferase TsaA
VISVEDDGTSLIRVYPEFADGLYRIDGMKDLDIIFVFDRSEGFDLRVHPRGDPNIPLTGVFGTRSPRRPNPIGLTRVRLLKRTGEILKVAGLDAFVDTPILDIKRAPGKESSWHRIEKNRIAGRPAVPRVHK